ncbi:MAG TPA: hypothetical protein VFI31_05440 [Pirellulales bacterium]|nr:hypothetical protein [Pirellulales bacterium]
MRWPTAMLLAACCTAGCRNSQPASDPFYLPSTRVPPPPTGAAVGAPDAYYTNPAPPMNGAAPSWPAPGPAPANGSNGLYSPPGGYQYQPSAPTPAPNAGSYLPSPGPAPARNASNAAPRSMRTNRVTQASYVTSVDETPSAVYESVGDSAGEQPELAANDASSAPIDIMDLPPVKRVARAR